MVWALPRSRSSEAVSWGVLLGLKQGPRPLDGLQGLLDASLPEVLLREEVEDLVALQNPRPPPVVQPGD